MLKIRNAHERDNHIHFEEGPHEYTIKKRKKFKEKYKPKKKL